MSYSLTTITEPETEPVDLTRAKAHLRIDHDDEDALVTGWIAAARRLAEEYTGRRFVTQTVRLKLCGFPKGAIELPVEPVSAVSLFTYSDTAGDTVALDSDEYQTWLDHSPPLVAPLANTFWPATESGALTPVVIEFTAGGASAEVPEMARTAILLTLGSWDGNRGDGQDVTKVGLPAGARALLDLLWCGSYR